MFYDLGGRGGADRRTGFATHRNRDEPRSAVGGLHRPTERAVDTATRQPRRTATRGTEGPSSGMKATQSTRSHWAGQEQRTEDQACKVKVEEHEL